jgi:hypothetical protein
MWCGDLVSKRLSKSGLKMVHDRRPDLKKLPSARQRKIPARSVGAKSPLPACGFQISLQCCMAEELKQFYDRLAANYHLIFEDWDASIKRQAAALAAILERECGMPKPCGFSIVPAESEPKR